MPAEAPTQEQQLRSSHKSVDVSAIESLFNENSEETNNSAPATEPAPETKPSVTEQVTNPVESESEPPVTEDPAPIEPEPTPEVTDELPADPPASPTSLGALLQNHGFQDVDDESAIPRLEAFMQQTQQERDQIAQLRNELEEQRRINAAIRAHQELNTPHDAAARTQQPQAQDQEEKPWWNPPQFSEQTVQKYRMRNPETGQDEWAPNTPTEVRNQFEAYQVYVEDWANRLFHDPVSVFSEMEQRIISKIQPEIQQTYEQRTADQQRQDRIHSISQENEWLWAVDPVTNQMVDSLSEKGRAVESMAGSLIANGLDRVMAYETAVNFHKPTPVESQQQVQQQARNDAAQKADERREELLRRSRPTPSRGGSLQTAPDDPVPAPQDPKLSYGQQLIQHLNEAG